MKKNFDLKKSNFLRKKNILIFKNPMLPLGNPTVPSKNLSPFGPAVYRIYEYNIQILYTIYK